MKTLLTSAALAAMMTTSAMANQTGTTDWGGNTNHLSAGCWFVTNANGIMEYTETTNGTAVTGVWTTTDAADVTIVVRQDAADSANTTSGVSVVPVKADGTTPGETIFQVDSNGNLVSGTEIAADIKYNVSGNSSLVVSKPTGWNESITENEVKVNNSGHTGQIDLDIAGTATIADANLSNANAEYRVRHLITCWNIGTGSIPDFANTTPPAQ
jgi:Asp-tRNA(Asn)/Glu-tRNA(Gln) amidotransferase C subunit